METSYSIALVITSFVVAVLGSFMALVLSRDARLRPPNRAGGLVFLAALSLGGVAIWSMHFIGMLAFSVHGVELNYNWWLTAFSLLVGIGIVYVGLIIMSYGQFGFAKLILAGIVVGLGVAAMHYVGMAAILVQADIQWNWTIIVISLAIAVVAATAALWLAVHVKVFWQMLASAVVMGIAVCGMHYTGMAAAGFEHNPALSAVTPMAATATTFAVSIVLLDFAILLWTSIIAMAEANSRNLSISQA